MLLLIDAGNTRVKWALADADAPAIANTGASVSPWLADGAVSHAQMAQLPADWRTALAGKTPDAALISNVAGAAMRASLSSLLAACGLAPQALTWFASLPQLAGVRNGYRNPAQLGCDRFAAAIGGHALAPRLPIIVATCGTATTIDAVDADGRFIGGMIVPGLGMMAAALARDTAQLPRVGDGAAAAAAFAPVATFADNTDDAIRSGCLAAQAGAIERACAAHGAALCLVSGGAGPAVAAVLALPIPHRVIDNIVLTGLFCAALAGPGE
jgi:type III pantothenate kinase